MMTISEDIAIAFQSYQAGNLSQAESICHQILQQQPDNIEALHLLSIVAHQLGKLKEAIVYYQQTIALMPEYAQLYYSLGTVLHALGQVAEAIAYYQQALALNPDDVDAHYDLGNAFKEQGNLNAAIEHYQQAIALNPNKAEAHGKLAYALQQQGQIESAITHYQQAIALRPDVPENYYNLGNAFSQQNQLEAAITQYWWAVALNPNYVDAYLKLAKSLHSSGKLEDAIFYYQHAISLQPNRPDAYYNLGNVLLEQGRCEEAITNYQQTLAVDPHFLDAYVRTSWALFAQYQFEEAIACLQQALKLNPDYPEAYHKLGIGLALQNKVDEAISYFQKAFQLKPDFVEAYWRSKLALPILYDTQKQIFIWRQRYCRGLNDLIQQTTLDTPENRKHALTGLKIATFTFYLGYQGLNDRGLQRKYGKFVHRVMAANYPQWVRPLPMPKLTNTGKIRVGYLSANFRTHTVALLTLGWLKNCDRQTFEIYTYYIGDDVDFTTQKFRSCSDGFHHISGNLEAVCEQIIADKLHILVFTDIGMNAQTTQIAALRLAPVQCTAWGHPVTSGLPTIDYYLSSDLMEPENARSALAYPSRRVACAKRVDSLTLSHYSEKLVRLPNIGICYQKPSIPKPRNTRSDFHLREEAVIYLSCQSLFKYLPQFDQIFAKIAQRVPQAQFAFISSPTAAITAQFQARLQRTFANFSLNSEDYCVFLPPQDRVNYFNLNLVSDIFLDTFSWSGGNTTLEAIACGLPVVTCPGEFMRGRHAYGILKMMGVTETIAQDEAEYVEIAVRLGLDAKWRQDMVRKIYKRHRRLYDDRTCVTALESFYKSVVFSKLRNEEGVGVN